MGVGALAALTLFNIQLLSLGVSVHRGPNSSIAGSGGPSAPQHYRRGKHRQSARQAGVRSQCCCSWARCEHTTELMSGFIYLISHNPCDLCGRENSEKSFLKRALTCKWQSVSRFCHGCGRCRSGPSDRILLQDGSGYPGGKALPSASRGRS